jgi:hypothetical protein
MRRNKPNNDMHRSRRRAILVDQPLPFGGPVMCVRWVPRPQSLMCEAVRPRDFVRAQSSASLTQPAAVMMTEGAASLINR